MALSDALFEAICDIQDSIKDSPLMYNPDDIESIQLALIELKIIQIKLDVNRCYGYEPDLEQVRRVAFEEISGIKLSEEDKV